MCWKFVAHIPCSRTGDIWKAGSCSSTIWRGWQQLDTQKQKWISGPGILKSSSPSLWCNATTFKGSMSLVMYQLHAHSIHMLPCTGQPGSLTLWLVLDCAATIGRPAPQQNTVKPSVGPTGKPAMVAPQQFITGKSKTRVPLWVNVIEIMLSPYLIWCRPIFQGK